MAKARLETVVTGDDSPFVQAVERAEKRARTFHDRLTALFKRDPTARAERALSGFAGSLASGDIQGAVVGLGERFRGLGLLAGVGLGAALIIFQKAKEQLDEVDKSVTKVKENLARPLSAQLGLGPEGIAKEINAASEAAEELAHKRTGIFNRIRESAIKSQPEYASGDPYTDQSPADRVPATAKAAFAIEERIKTLTMARARAEVEIAQQKQIAVNGSEEEAALLKNQLDYQKRISEIQLESGLTKPGRSAQALALRMAAAKAEREAGADAIGKKVDLLKLQEESEARILDLHNTTLSKDQQAIAALKERVELLKQQKALTNDPLKQAAIQNQIQGTQNQIQSAQYNESKKPWGQRAAEMMQQQDFQNYVRNQQPSGPDAYKSHPDAYNRRDILGNKIDESGNVIGAGGSGPDKQGVGLLGRPGVLDRIEVKIDGIGANK